MICPPQGRTSPPFSRPGERKNNSAVVFCRAGSHGPLSPRRVARRDCRHAHPDSLSTDPRTGRQTPLKERAVIATVHEILRLRPDLEASRGFAQDDRRVYQAEVIPSAVEGSQASPTPPARCHSSPSLVGALCRLPTVHRWSPPPPLFVLILVLIFVDNQRSRSLSHRPVASLATSTKLPTRLATKGIPHFGLRHSVFDICSFLPLLPG